MPINLPSKCSLEITPEEVAPADRMARVRLMKPVQNPTEFLHELKAILVALHDITNSVHRIIPRILAAANVIADPDPNKIRMDDIVKVVSNHFEVTSLDIHSHRRLKSVIRPRHVAMYLCRVLTTRSMPEIGKYFNGRDHSTVFHAIKGIEDVMRKDSQFSKEVTLLSETILTDDIP